jgi:radical SAM superfamily enzyme YgiQ (UPF0313 family)
MFCVGEGEEPMLELCEALRTGKGWTSIPNFINRFRTNAVRGYQKDLDSLPFWDFEITDTEKILNLRKGWLSISFSRGCPYECTFCINHLYKKIEIGENDKMSDYLRRRSPDNVITELYFLAKRYPVKFFNIDDDLLTMNKDWMREFTQGYKEKIYCDLGIMYVINARANTLTDDMVKMLAESGCKEARIGFETGNEELRNGLLKKRITDVELEKAFATLRKYKVQSVAFSMIGIPDESWSTFFDTVNMFIRIQPSLIRMTFLFPYKHTTIYDICIERDLFKKDFLIDNNRDYGSPLTFANLSDQELFCMRFMLPWYINYEWFLDLRYLDAITEFSDFTHEELLEKLPEIITKDKELSLNCKHDHYRYYGNNEYYFEYVTIDK